MRLIGFIKPFSTKIQKAGRIRGMAYGSIPLEKRLRENIKSYKLENLYDLEKVQKLFRDLGEAFGMELLLTQRHGETAVAVGDFSDFEPDVETEPGRKIRVAERTIGHLYVKLSSPEAGQKIEAVLDDLAELYSFLGEKQYRFRETAIYADELEEALEKDRYQAKHGEHVDALTGLLNKTYFDGRLKLLKETGTAPDALICVNINDWKFVNSNYGDEESDRLIKTVADILKMEAKPDYLIGRVDGDVFYIVIEVPEDGEALDYCRRIKEACLAFEDSVLAPSVAIGMVTRLSVEEDFAEGFSEAEYEMFRDKFDEKNSPGYRERLEKGLVK